MAEVRQVLNRVRAILVVLSSYRVPISSCKVSEVKSHPQKGALICILQTQWQSWGAFWLSPQSVPDWCEYFMRMVLG